MTYRYVWCELNGKKVLDSKCSGPKPEIVLSCDTSRTCTIETTSQTIDISYGTWRTGRWGEVILKVLDIIFVFSSFYFY